MKYWVLYDFLCRSDLPIATFFVGRNSDSRPLSIFCRSDLPSCARDPHGGTHKQLPKYFIVKSKNMWTVRQ